MYTFNWALTAFRSESYIGSATALPDIGQNIYAKDCDFHWKTIQSVHQHHVHEYSSLRNVSKSNIPQNMEKSFYRQRGKLY